MIYELKHFCLLLFHTKTGITSKTLFKLLSIERNMYFHPFPPVRFHFAMLSIFYSLYLFELNTEKAAEKTERNVDNFAFRYKFYFHFLPLFFTMHETICVMRDVKRFVFSSEWTNSNWHAKPFAKRQTLMIQSWLVRWSVEAFYDQFFTKFSSLDVI